MSTQTTGVVAARDGDTFVDFGYRQTPDRIFGLRETYPVDYGQLIVLPQVRAGFNPERSKLTSSIASQGLINPLDVAHLDEVAFKEYVSFVGELWKMPIDHAAYQDQADEYGMYHLVIAGHSRYVSIGDVMKQEGIADAQVQCKIYRDATPNEIIGIQLAENIHSQPPKERQAIAIVEAYHYGIQTGQWGTKKEFLETAGSKFSRNTLDAALNFANLPLEIRDFIFAGSLPYSAGIELGKSVPIIEAWALMKSGAELHEDEDEAKEAVHDIVDAKLLRMVTTIQNRKLNGPAAVKLVQGQVNEWEGQIVREQEGFPVLDLVMVSPTEQLRSIRDEARKEYLAELERLASGPISSIERALQLHTAHGKEMLPPNAIQELTARVTNYTRSLGSATLQLEF
jgi:hypothetical protein